VALSTINLNLINLNIVEILLNAQKILTLAISLKPKCLYTIRKKYIHTYGEITIDIPVAVVLTAPPLPEKHVLSF
jgi:hypothetical protein